eukprot:14016-Heterococcus_DN1.PRE.2
MQFIVLTTPERYILTGANYTQTADGLSMIVNGTGSSTTACIGSSGTGASSVAGLTAAVRHNSILRNTQLSKVRVLVVEDDLVTCKLVTAWLHAADATVIVCYDGRSGVEAVAKNTAEGTPFKVVLMDFQLPLLNGIDAIREIRAWESAHSAQRTAILGMSGQ